MPAEARQREFLNVRQQNTGTSASAQLIAFRAGNPIRIRRVYFDCDLGTRARLRLTIGAGGTRIMQVTSGPAIGPVDLQNLSGVNNKGATGTAINFEVAAAGGAEEWFLHVEYEV